MANQRQLPYGVTTDDATHHTFNFGHIQVRTIERGGEIWFVAADVCAALDLVNPRQAVSRLDDDERDTVAIDDAMGRPQETIVINESGLYSLILTSRKEGAKRFKKWVTSEVLPSIRKTGSYAALNAEPSQKLLARPPKRSRDDLSFTRRDEQGRMVNWHVDQRMRMWADSIQRGEEFFREVAELAANDEREAYAAVRFAFMDEWSSTLDGSTQWSNRGAGEEMGFAEAVARAVIDGLRARREGVEPYDPESKSQDSSRPPSGRGRKLLSAVPTPSIWLPFTEQRLPA